MTFAEGARDVSGRKWRVPPPSAASMSLSRGEATLPMVCRSCPDAVPLSVWLAVSSLCGSPSLTPVACRCLPYVPGLGCSPTVSPVRANDVPQLGLRNELRKYPGVELGWLLPAVLGCRPLLHLRADDLLSAAGVDLSIGKEKDETAFAKLPWPLKLLSLPKAARYLDSAVKLHSAH